MEKTPRHIPGDETQTPDRASNTSSMSGEYIDGAQPLDGTSDVVHKSVDETLCDERSGETPMATETLDRVTEEFKTTFDDTDDSPFSLTRGPRSRFGNKWFNKRLAQSGLEIEILVGLPNSLSDLWVNIPSVVPPCAEDVERRQRGYAQLTDPEYSRRLNKFLDDIKTVMTYEEYQEEETDAA